jgi:hypothetical protein
MTVYAEPKDDWLPGTTLTGAAAEFNVVANDIKHLYERRYLRFNISYKGASSLSSTGSAFHSAFQVTIADGNWIAYDLAPMTVPDGYRIYLRRLRYFLPEYGRIYLPVYDGGVTLDGAYTGGYTTQSYTVNVGIGSPTTETINIGDEEPGVSLYENSSGSDQTRVVNLAIEADGGTCDFRDFDGISATAEIGMEPTP